MIRLALRVTPRAQSDAIDAIDVDASGRPKLMVRVRAAPSDGEANVAVLRLVARWLALAPSAVTLVRGDAAREKLVEVAIDPGLLDRAIETWRLRETERP